MFKKSLILFVLAIIAVNSVVFAVPQMIDFQGRLLDKGKPVNDKKDITFRFYSSEVDQVPLLGWLDEKKEVKVNNGIFNTKIGSIENPIPQEIFDGKEIWVEVEIGEEKLPRQQLSSVGYAIKALDAETIKGKSPEEFILMDTSEKDKNQLILPGKDPVIKSEKGGEIKFKGKTRVLGELAVGANSVYIGSMTATSAENYIKFDNTNGLITSKDGNLIIDVEDESSSLYLSTSGRPIILGGKLQTDYTIVTSSSISGVSKLQIEDGSGQHTTPLIIRNDSAMASTSVSLEMNAYVNGCYRGSIKYDTDGGDCRLFLDPTIDDAIDGIVIYDDLGERPYLGIGTDTPADPLHILADSGHDNIQLEENYGGEDWELGVDADGDLNFEDDGTARIAFKDGGNVGIGTDNPDKLLHIYNGSGDAAVKIESGDGEPCIYFRDVSGPQVVIAQTNYGLEIKNSTVTESVALSIGTDLSSVDQNILLHLYPKSNNDSVMSFYEYTEGIKYVLGVDVSDDSKFKISQGDELGAYNMDAIIISTTSLGVGVSPLDKLDINGDIRIRGDYIKDAGGTERIVIKDDGRLDLKDSSGNYVLRIDTSGRVGIGVSPDEKLHVAGNIKMVDGNEQAGRVLTSDANGVASWQDSGVSDDLGNHVAIQDLNMSTFGIVNIATMTFSDGTYINSTTTFTSDDEAAAIYLTKSSAAATYLELNGGTLSGSITSSQDRLQISTDVYVVGYASATTFYGDGSNLTNIAVSGDDMGSHIATRELNMNDNDIFGVNNTTTVYLTVESTSCFKETVTISSNCVLTNGGAFSGFGIMPIGSIIAWHKSFSNTPALPDGWLECNGQTITDTDSVYYNQTLPDLNGDARFLRGSSTSGTEQTDAFQGHWHDVSATSGGYEWYAKYNATYLDGSGEDAYEPRTANGSDRQKAKTIQSDNSNGTPRIAEETRPINMSVVWIIRIK